MTQMQAASPIQIELLNPLNPYSGVSLNPKFTFIDLFAGIGGFRLALEQLGGKCLGYAEIDREAISVYQTNFIRYINAEEPNLGDISQLGYLPHSVDVIVGGVPCQPWSIAGQIKGFADKRGQLWFDVIRLVQLNQPKLFIFENVKGLTEPRHLQSLQAILSQLRQAGYWVNYQVLNSYDFGLAQDRDRVFIVGIHEQLENQHQFQFPKPLNQHPKLYDFIAGVSKRPVQKQKISPSILFGDRPPASRNRFQKNDELNDFFVFADIRDGHTTIHSWDLIETSDREKSICTTILKNRRKKIYGPKDGNPLEFHHLVELIPDLHPKELENLIAKKILRFDSSGYEFVNSKISAGIHGVAKIILAHADAIGTLTATGMRDYIATIYFDCQDHKRYKQEFIQRVYQRKKYKPITAQDYARLQGFPEWFQLAKRESTAKKQLGNAVSVPVVYHLAKSLVKVLF